MDNNNQKLAAKPVKVSGNINDYMKWRGDVPLSGSPFNEIDNIILAISTFVDFSGIVPSDVRDGCVPFPDAVKAFDKKGNNYLGVLIHSDILDVARNAAACPRYSKIELCGFVNEVDENKEMQFSALTYVLPDNSIYVAFRGTDDTIVGWKEDIMLASRIPLPAHTRAAEYIKEAGRAFPIAKVNIGGHSKGGNLAMWAGAYAPDDVKRRIGTIYNNDGPGFLPDVVESDEYKSVADRIITYIPQSSVVGTLLCGSPVKVLIRSRELGILQHDPLSWDVMGRNFIRVKKRSPFGEQADEIMSRWVNSMEQEEREKFAEALFDALDATGAKTLTDLSSAKFKNLGIILKTFRTMDKDTKDIVSLAMKQLRDAANKKK